MEKLDWYGRPVTPYDDIIDSRNIQARIDEILWDHTLDEGEVTPVSEWSDSDRAEYQALSELMEELPEDAGTDGVTLIHEAYFTRHIQEEHLEIGPEFHEQDPECRWEKLIPVSRDDLFSRSPFKFINWEAVAGDHWSDYSQVEFLGTTYLHIGD